jgi:hypothetical protein
VEFSICSRSHSPAVNNRPELQYSGSRSQTILGAVQYSGSNLQQVEFSIVGIIQKPYSILGVIHRLEHVESVQWEFFSGCNK